MCHEKHSERLSNIKTKNLNIKESTKDDDISVSLVSASIHVIRQFHFLILYFDTFIVTAQVVRLKLL